MICYRRPSRQVHCQYCRQPIMKGEIALSSWVRWGWCYVHIKCAMRGAKMYHCKTQAAVSMKEALKATRQAIADLMRDKMIGESK